MLQITVCILIASVAEPLAALIAVPPVLPFLQYEQRPLDAFVG